MKRSLLLAATLLATTLVFATSVSAQESRDYSLQLLLDGVPINWDAGDGANRNGEYFSIEDISVPFTIYFEGGRLELQPADFGTFAQPHVTGIRFRRGVEPTTLSLGATVRHQGNADDYTDTIAFDGAEGGRLSVPPQDESKAFTQSKDAMKATGEVRFSALDSVRSGEGSAIVIDFSQAPFRELERATLRYELVVQPQD